MRPRTRPAGQAGGASIELVILLPVVLTLVLLAVQLGLWLHARQVADAAAQEGLAATQVEGGTAAAGQQRAAAFLAAAGGVQQPLISIDRRAKQARVAVTGHAPAVLPLLEVGVTVTAAGPVEHFVAESERQ